MSTATSPYQTLVWALQRSWRRYHTSKIACSSRAKRKTVHELRTDLRRLITLMDVVQELGARGEAARLRRRLKRELNCVRDLRDLQAQEKHTAPGAFRSQLRQWIKKEQLNVERYFARAAPKRQCLELVFGLSEDLVAQAKSELAEKRARPRLERLLLKRYRSFEVTSQRAHASLPLSFHRSRIEFKKFRYTWEVLAPLVPLSAATEIRLKALQDNLGEIQDTSVLITLLLRFLVSTGKPQPSPEFLRGLHQAEQRQDEAIAKFLAGRNRLLREVRPHPGSLRQRAA